MKKILSLIVILVIVVLLGVIRADDKRKETYIAKDVLILEIKEGLEESNLPEEEKAKYCDSIINYQPHGLQVDTKGNIYLLFNNSFKGKAGGGVTVDEKGNVIYLKSAEVKKDIHFVRKYDKDGNYIKTINWRPVKRELENESIYYNFLVDEDENIYITSHKYSSRLDKYDKNGKYIRTYNTERNVYSGRWNIHIDKGGIYDGGKLLFDLDRKGLKNKECAGIDIETDYKKKIRYIKGLRSIGGLVDRVPLMYKQNNKDLGLHRLLGFDKDNNFYIMFRDDDPKNLGKDNIIYGKATGMMIGPKYLQYYLVKCNKNGEIVTDFKLNSGGWVHITPDGTIYQSWGTLNGGYRVTKYEKQSK